MKGSKNSLGLAREREQSSVKHHRNDARPALAPAALGLSVGRAVGFGERERG